MRQLHVVLTTPEGDEIGRRSLSGFTIADGGQIGGVPVRAGLLDQMDDMCRKVTDTLNSEQVATSLDDLGVRVALSRALLCTPDGSDVCVPIPVDAVGAAGLADAAGAGGGDRSGAPELVDWDDLLGVGGSERAEGDE